jgi:hypothetical protein
MACIHASAKIYGSNDYLFIDARLFGPVYSLPGALRTTARYSYGNAQKPTFAIRQRAIIVSLEHRIACFFKVLDHGKIGKLHAASFILGTNKGSDTLFFSSKYGLFLQISYLENTKTDARKTASNKTLRPCDNKVFMFIKLSLIA